MSCEECRELSTHAFRTPDDLLHAVRLAAEEVDRGVLARVNSPALESAAQEALDSTLDIGALPNRIAYRFRCTVCGDLFTLEADASTGEGGWTRDEKP
jgi:hypothetical protein